jgi:hypothetical protein
VRAIAVDCCYAGAVEDGERADDPDNAFHHN